MTTEVIDLLIFAAMVFVLLSAELIIHAVYSKYANISSELEINGREVAERMLLTNGINDVKFGTIDRDLGDFYNSKSKTIYLSKRGAKSDSVAAIAVRTRPCQQLVI